VDLASNCRLAEHWRRRLVNRFYQFEASAQTIAEQDHWHLCREILRRALEGWSDPWVVAHYYLYGIHPDKLRADIRARNARQLWELHRPTDRTHPTPVAVTRRCGESLVSPA
jgi:hypothetical protein